MISREEMEALVVEHLQPALKKLEERGVGAVLICAPIEDPPDGRAIVTTSFKDVDPRQTAAHFAKAALKIHAGNFTQLERTEGGSA